ncbi:hypothetical protein V1525DRAFT_389788 [Lipomyces kononenkoae]|uniref:Uncharacterized protein n=1 Tax=Lipomyces kononenkoae TaxID=34357 RepID=A0ACC3SWX1_LIPKO
MARPLAPVRASGNRKAARFVRASSSGQKLHGSCLKSGLYSPEVRLVDLPKALIRTPPKSILRCRRSAPNSRKSSLSSSITSEDQQRADDGDKLRALKICLFPTTSQKETLRKWFGAQRYNKELRAVPLNSKTNKLKDSEKWLDEYQYDLKDEAIRDFMKIIKATWLYRLQHISFDSFILHDARTYKQSATPQAILGCKFDAHQRAVVVATIFHSRRRMEGDWWRMGYLSDLVF